ncbi:hypothetical protein [Nitrosospira multiformis]|nr:hypothetical protein [Nitrosospira multiformis]
MVLQSIVDLANGNKHWELTHDKSLERQVITEVYERTINDWYAYFIAGPRVYIVFGDYKLSMMELIHQVLGYFKWIFEGGDIALPLELQRQLELCRIPKT